MMNKRKLAIFIINLLIVLSTLIITIIGVFFGASSGQLGDDIIGLSYFKPFTIDSNVFMGVCSLILIIKLIIDIIKKEDHLPRWIEVLYYAGVTSVALTMLTVIFFLTPTVWIESGFNAALNLYLKDMTFFHIINPILSIISFMLFGKYHKLGVKENIIVVVPMLIYSIVYLINVAFLKTWNDFYGFTFGGKMYLIPIVLIVMYLITYLIGFALRKIKMSLKSKEEVK